MCLLWLECLMAILPVAFLCIRTCVVFPFHFACILFSCLVILGLSLIFHQWGFFLKFVI